jgi:hypothetical protein
MITGKKKPKCFGGGIPPPTSATLSTTNFICTTLALNLDLCYEKPTNNCRTIAWPKRAELLYYD